MADSPVDAPAWLEKLFLDRGTPAPVLLRAGRSHVWASGHLVAKVHPRASDAERASEQAMAAHAGAVVPVAHPQGVSEGPDSVVTWWQRVHMARPASGQEILAWLNVLHDCAPAPARQASLVLTPPPTLDADETLLDCLEPVIAEQTRAAQAISALPSVFVHADANPTNIVVDDVGRTVGLDFEFAGAGPRVFDVATAGVLQEETGAGTLEQALAAYGEREDVTMELLRQAATVVRANRIAVCALHPGWLAEGWDRLNAWRAGRSFVFPSGAGPK